MKIKSLFGVEKSVSEIAVEKLTAEIDSGIYDDCVDVFEMKVYTYDNYLGFENEDKYFYVLKKNGHPLDGLKCWNYRGGGKVEHPNIVSERVSGYSGYNLYQAMKNAVARKDEKEKDFKEQKFLNNYNDWLNKK